MKKSKHEKKIKYPVLLFCGVTYTQNTPLHSIEQELCNSIGPFFDKSNHINFSIFTEFYHKEMGLHLTKYIISFLELFPLENLHFIKKKTIAIETLFKKNNKRIVNLDPGYLSLAKTNMFSTKDFSHRTYIGNDIFGEVNLIFNKYTQEYKPCLGTYPDFQTKIFRDFLKSQRSLYKEKIKNIDNHP